MKYSEKELERIEMELDEEEKLLLESYENDEWIEMKIFHYPALN